MQESTRKRAGWTALVLFVALWVFVVFFFDAILAHFARVKLIDAVDQGTHSEYRLSFTRFTYHRGVIFAKGTDLRRIAYREGEHGTTLRDMTIDSARITGISWWKILLGKPIALSIFRTYQPKVYLCDIDPGTAGRAQWKLLPPYHAPPASAPSDLTVSFDSVLIPGVVMYEQAESGDHPAGAMSFSCEDFSYDTKSNTLGHLGMKRFDLDVPWMHYADSNFSFYIDSARVTSVDSLLTVDTFAYASGSDSLVLRCSGVRGSNIQFMREVAGNGIAMRSLQTRTWALAMTAKKDTTHRASNGPWQEQLAKSVGFPIVIDSFDLRGGALDVHFPNASALAARGLDLHAAKFDLDSNNATRQMLFSREFDIAATTAGYTARSASVQVKNLVSNIQDSLITAGNVSYNASAKGNAPVQFSDVRIVGLGFDSLIAGTEVVANSLTAHGWKISGLPSANSASKSKSKKTAKTIWETQHDIAASVGIPIRIGGIDLEDGSVRIASPSILADRARIKAVGFDLDSSVAASKALLFSKDVDVTATRFRYADQGEHNIIDLQSTHSQLSRRSVSAGSAEYLSRSTFEPSINYMSYRFNDLDIAGIDFQSLLANKKISLGSVRTHSWAINSSADTTKPPAQSKKPTPAWTETITIGHAALPNGTVLFRERDSTSGGYSPTLSSKISTLDVTDFRFLPPKGKRPRLAFGQVVCAVPTFTYDKLGGNYRFVVRNLNGNLRNSIVTMDSLCYSPKYSEDEYAARHPYASGRTDFRLAPVRISGIDTKRLIASGSIDVQSFDAPTAWVDYYIDRRRPADPHPAPAVLPNDIIRKLNIPITADTIQIEDADIQIREHTVNNAPPGNFTFQLVKASAAPVTFDSASPLIDTPTTFGLSGVFIAQAQTQATVVYALHDSTLNLSVDGTMGPFDLKQLNTYLVNAARIEVTGGTFTHADVALRIDGGNAQSRVVPIYDHLKIRVLPPDPNDPADITESVMTFLANSFVLHNDNPDEMKGPPKVGATTLTRQPSDEFFQFLWLAIRKSLGSVVGGMK